MSSLYSQVLEDCISEEIGDGGLSTTDFARYLSQADLAVKKIRGSITSDALPFLTLAKQREDLKEIDEIATKLASSFDDVIVLGMGGSSLGARALCSLAVQKHSTRIHFIDNVDPFTVKILMKELDWTLTGIIAISKSGTTTETLALLGIVVSILRDHVEEEDIRRRLVVITDACESPLSNIAKQLDCRFLAHAPNVGGRYSAFSSTGLLPARVLGLDIESIRDGAALVLTNFQEQEDVAEIPPAAGAAMSVGLNRLRGHSATVIMPYCDRLNNLGLWYCQLWAESLGKNGEGILPVRALGVVDQHSQLQLYLDGPADKMFSLILTDTAGDGHCIPDSFTASDELSYLQGRTLGDLLAAEGWATAETLANNGRPTRIISMPQVSERSFGALMMHFMIETVVAAELLGVDAFSQPAVEEGKIITRRFLKHGQSA